MQRKTASEAAALNARVIQFGGCCAGFAGCHGRRHRTYAYHDWSLQVNSASAESAATVNRSSETVREQVADRCSDTSKGR